MKMEVLDAQNYSSCLLEQLHELQQNNLHCDARLTADGGGISAHKIVLMAASSYLNSCFSTKVQSELGSKGFVHIKDMPLKLVERVVSFIYTGKLLICKEDFDNTYKLCKNLEIPKAVMLCENYQRNLGMDLEGNREETLTLPVMDISHEREEIRERNEKPLTDHVEYRHEEGKNLPHDTNIFEDKIMENCVMEKKSRSLKKSQTKSLPDENSNSNRKTKKTEEKKKCVKVKRLESKKVKKSSNYKKKRPSWKNESVKNDVTGHSVGVEDVYIDIGGGQGSDHEESEATSTNSQPIAEISPKIDMQNGHSIRSKSLKNSSVLDRRKTQVNNKQTNTKQDDKRNIKVRRYKRFPCSFCSRILTSHKRHAFHEYIKHGAPFDEKRYTLYQCPVEGCSHVSESNGNLQTHLKSRHGEDRPHVCEFCGKAFKLPNVLAIHLNIHTGSKMWKCTTCGEQFNQQSGLSVHVKRHHLGEASWGELCHLCSEKFLQKCDLAWHLFRVHSVPLPDGYRIYTCEICNFQTKSIQDLERHKNAHKGIKQFSCSICKKMCSTKSQLKRHESFHGEKSFKCTYDNCTYACTDSIGLSKHIKLMHTHKHLKPYVCPVCSYKTGVKGNLDKHIRQVHSLIVVAKHTVQLKMKYANFESGDIITKDGQLVASAKQRKELYRQYIEQNRMTINNSENKPHVAEKPNHIPENRIIFHDEDERKEHKTFAQFKPLSIDFQQESSSNYAMNLSSVNSSHTHLSAPLLHPGEIAPNNVVYVQGPY